MSINHTLSRIRREATNKGRVVFVSGKFNVPHPGHMRLFRFAREIGDYLIVGVYPDNYVEDIYVDQEVRLEGVASSNWVDAAFILDASPEATIVELEPEVVVKGKEHERYSRAEIEAVESYGGILVFCSGVHQIPENDVNGICDLQEGIACPKPHPTQIDKLSWIAGLWFKLYMLSRYIQVGVGYSAAAISYT